MFKSVVTKLWIYIFIIVALFLFVFAFILNKKLEKIYYSHEIKLMKEHNLRWAQILQSSTDYDKVQKEMEYWNSIAHYQIDVYDSNKITRFTSDPRVYPLGKKINWLHTGKIIGSETIYTDYHPEYKTDMTAVFLPVTLKNGEKLTIMTHTSNHELMEIGNTIKKVTFILLIVFTVFGGLIIFLLSRWLAHPLIKIKKAAVDIAAGNFDISLDLKRNDELGDLADTINNLAARLKRTIRTLHNTNQELNNVLNQWKDFLADVSHELRTPLFLISGYTEAIMDKVVDEKKATEEYLPVIHKESLRLQKLVNDLTKVEKITSLDKKKTNLSNLIQNTLKPFKISLKNKAITLEVDGNIKDFPDICLDPERFSEVIFNLVDNAIRHTPAGGTICIDAKIKNKILEMKICDTGTGIPNEHLPRLFDRFYRVDKSRSRAQGGSGLGLAIVKKIIDLHQGKIAVKSTENIGTTFTITIPI